MATPATSVWPEGLSRYPGDRVQRQALSADSFENVTVAKNFTKTNINSVDDALAYLKGNTAKLVEMLQMGCDNEARKEAAKSSEGWFEINEDGTATPFSGKVLDKDKYGALVLGLAKNAFGHIYATDREKAKEQAKAILKATPALLSNLVMSPSETATDEPSV